MRVPPSRGHPNGIPGRHHQGVSMRRTILLGTFIGLLVAAATLDGGAATGTARQATAAESTGVAAVCPTVQPGDGQCMAVVVTKSHGSSVPLASSTYERGLTPADIQDAYNLPTGLGAGSTVALVEAKDYPNLESDLATYRAQFGLPPCTTASGCLRIVDERGGSKPPGNGNGIGWFEETALDVDAVSAACPLCHILVVEADSVSKKDLAISNGTAARLGAVAVSNSWKNPEFQNEADGPLARYFDHPGVAFTASSGDGGAGPRITVGFPAGLPTVIAVGGTSLTRANNARGWTESAWAGAGSACGEFIAKPAWQTDTGCPNRTTSDVSAVADPKTGFAVYVTDTKGGLGWLVFGGTSVSAPLIAGIYGLADNTAALGSGISQHLYQHAGDLFDVTTGNNGTCTIDYICNARPGYDGPTGLGTPNGIGAF
jgi:subtilase family serine protease